MQIHKIQNFVHVMFRPTIRRDNTYVGCKYTYFITSSGIFQALIVSDRLYVKCQNTSCFGWSKSFVAHIQHSSVAIRSNLYDFQDFSRTNKRI